MTASPRRRSVRYAMALFRTLMRLMPASYVTRQRQDATALMDRLAVEADHRGGTRALIGVAVPAIVDLVARIIAEHMVGSRRRTRWTRPARGWFALAFEGTRRNVRDGLRSIRCRPVQSAAVIGTLALGIGLNAAVFSVVDWVLLRPLAYPSPEELVRVWVADKAGQGAPGAVTYSEVQRLSAAPALRAAVGFSTATRVISAPGLEPVHVVVARVTGDLFGVFGAFPQVGRPFDIQEVASGQPVVVVSQAFWRHRLSSDPAIVGRPISIDKVTHTIVGVMPAAGYPRDADVWRPTTAAEREDDDRENVMIARLRGGGGLAGAIIQLGAIVPAAGGAPDAPRRVVVEPFQHAEVRAVRGALLLILGAAALVLLVACANVATLLGVRGAERAGELAVRGALGARSGQLARQLITECLLLALAGGASGVLLGSMALRLVVAVAPGGMPRFDEITLDDRVVALGVIATLLVGVVVGVAPAWRASRVDLRTALGSSGSSRTCARTRGSRVLVATQVALAVVLTIGAGLLVRSLQHLVALDHGFNPERLVAVNLGGSLRGIDPADARVLFRTLIEAAQAVPGVTSAAVAFRLPSEVGGLRVSVQVEGKPAGRPSPATLRLVTPGYFETVGIRLVDGRTISAADTRQAPRIAIVNTAFARGMPEAGGGALNAQLMTDVVGGRLTVVGVVADVTPAGEPDRPALYLPYEQWSINAGSLLVRTDGNPSALLPSLIARLRAAGPDLALDRVQRMDDVLAAGRSVTRFNAVLASSFGVLALALAMIGIYGLVAGEVTIRRRESSVRAALGATRGDVLWSVMRPIGQTMALALAAGVAAALAVATVMRASLHGVSPLDPLTFLALPAFLAFIGLAAALLAARPLLRQNSAEGLRNP